MTIDQDKLMAFIGQFAGDLGATIAAGGAVIGHRLGLYRALAEGPATPEELADRVECSPRYIAEWLRGQAAGGYVGYEPSSGTFALSEEQAFTLADPDGPVYLPGAFVLALGALRAEPRITEAFRTGAGYGWDQQEDDVFDGCELFFRPGYLANLVPNWIPALDGVEERLRAGGRVADVGTGLGALGGAHGPGVPGDHGQRIGLPRGLHPDGPQARRRGRVGRPRGIRVGIGAGLLRVGLRPRGDLRQPARHG